MKNDEIKVKVENLKLSIESYSKLKNGIKRSISEKLTTIIKFIKHGPGIVNQEIASRSLGDVKKYIEVWVKDSSVVKDWYEEINSIKQELFPSKNELLSEILEEKVEEERKIIDKRDRAVESKEILDKPAVEMIRRYRVLFPDTLEKLDIVYVPIGVIPHYCIVYKVIGDITYVLSITSNKNNEYVGHVIKKSRFWSGSTAVYSLHQVPTRLAMSMYVMPFDSKTEGNQILRECTEFLTNGVLIKSRRKKK